MKQNCKCCASVSYLKRPGRVFPAGREGVVLLEYVLLATVLLVALAVGAPALFNPFPGVEPSGNLDVDFGLVGAAFLRWYWSIVDLVALPVP